jgi:fatty acid desaturase
VANQARASRVFLWVHAILTVVWALLAVPTLVWWKESILWVALMSLYANFVGHFSAWQAVRAEEAQRESNEGK